MAHLLRPLSTPSRIERYACVPRRQGGVSGGDGEQRGAVVPADRAQPVVAEVEAGESGELVRVRVGNVREVGAEVDLAGDTQVADAGQDRRRERAHAGGEVGERHGGVEPDVRVALRQYQKISV